MVAHYLHEAVDPHGTKTVEEFDRVLHDLTPDQEPRRIRELTRAVREKQGRTQKQEGRRLQSGYSGTEPATGANAKSLSDMARPGGLEPPTRGLEIRSRHSAPPSQNASTGLILASAES